MHNIQTYFHRAELAAGLMEYSLSGLTVSLPSRAVKDRGEVTQRRDSIRRFRWRQRAGARGSKMDGGSLEHLRQRCIASMEE